MNFSTKDLAKTQTRGEGVQKPGNFVDVITVWPLKGFHAIEVQSELEEGAWLLQA